MLTEPVGCFEQSQLLRMMCKWVFYHVSLT